MVMHNGAEVEKLDAKSLADRKVTQDYTRRLLTASAGFVRTDQPAAR
jgi:peptide/nickel transport system ATP-binding protein